MKKKLLFLLVTLLLLLLGLFLNVQSKMSNVKSPNTTLVVPTPTISKDLPDPDKENKTTPIFEEQDAAFAITLSNVTGAYLITILKSPFEENRLKAEEYFLNKLNIDKEDACKLKVNIGTMRFVNPNEAGQTFHLSFCTAP